MDYDQPPLFHSPDQETQVRTHYSQQEVAVRTFYLNRLLEEASKG